MDIALIPPTSLLYTAAERHVHMVIPEGLKSSVYRTFYKVLSMRGDTTLLLDNGAFEAAGPQGPLSDDQLIQAIFDFNIDRFVLPDYLGDIEKTLASAERFLHVWNLHQQTIEQKPITFIAPVQGATRTQLEACINRYILLEEEFEIPLTFGLPRWIADEIDRHIRLSLADYIANRFPNNIHLLGLSPSWANEVQYHNRNVRSMDTSAPYVWTIAGLRLGVDERPAQRPDNYFAYDCRDVDMELLGRNIAMLDGWANGS